MDKKKFQDAFSVVRASDALRLEVANKMQENKKPARLTRKILIAAAVIALLVTTALAAPAVLDAINGGHTELFRSGVGKPDDLPGGDKTYDGYNVHLDVTLNPDAPDDILVHYLPEVPEKYRQYAGFKTEIERLYVWSASAEPRGFDSEDGIVFYQWPGGFWNDRAEKGIDWAYWITVPEGEKPQERKVELGGVNGYLVESSYGYGSRIFWWSNGDYMFMLEVPDEYTDAQLAALVESVHEVEDIGPYIFYDYHDDLQSPDPYTDND